MEVVVEAGAHAQQQPWDQFKEEVEIMEEQHGGGGGGGGADAVEELLTREIRKRLHHADAHEHGSSNGNGNGNGNGARHANGGEQEEVKVAPGEEEQRQHSKSIFFDPAKGLWKCRHCDWTYRLASQCENGILDHRGYHHRIKWNPKSLVQKELSSGSMNRVPDIITEVTASDHVTGTMRSSAEKEDTHRTLTPKGKGLEAHENGNAQEINHGPSNGKLENGSHSNGSHQVPDGTKPKIEYMFEINKTEIYPSEVNKDGQVTEAQPTVEEYDLEKILDVQETYDLYCPKCESCITRRVILKKRKRTVPTSPTGERPKRPDIEGAVPPVTLPDRVEGAPPDVFRCLSCFSFFIPTGCSFNIFRIFRRRDVGGQPDVLPRPASEDMPPHSENCTSWLLSCFQPGDSPNQPAHAADLATVPLLSSTQNSDDTTRITKSSTSYVHRSHGTVVKPEHLAVESHSENQAAADPATMPLQSEMHNSNDTTTKTEHMTSSVYHSEGTVVRPEHLSVGSPSGNKGAADSPRIPPSPGTTTRTTETNESYVTKQSTVDSSSQNQTTTTVISETNTTSSTTRTGAPSASSQTSSSTEYFKQDVVTGRMPSGGAIMDITHPQIGYKDAHGTTENDPFPSYAIQTPDFKGYSPIVSNMVPGPRFIPGGDMPTSPNPQPADHVVVPVSGGGNQVAPRPQQRDDWDILKAIVYGGLVESVTSLSVVSAAASSGAKTLDIFILGIANLIGGLPLIFHNIADLRDIQDVDGNDEQVGHYWLQLGRRSKAQLHMVMALLSYMVFGLLPPVLYGLSFRESNDRENKMMAVASTSLACVALLALGKAHVHTRTYFKTLMYYLTVAVSSSGLSYVAGMLITRLLVHYGIIEEGGSAAPALPGLSSPFAYASGADSSAWASF